LTAQRANLKRAGRWLVLAGLVAASWYALDRGYFVIPEAQNPWAPLDAAAPINWTTQFKLARISRDAAMCLTALARSGLRYERLPERQGKDGCALENAVRVRALPSAAVGEPFALSCRSAVALALWERHVMQPAARAYFDAPVVRIEHYGSYACRNIYGRKDAPLSRHATGDAIDVAGFTLANGKHMSVARDWPRSSSEALFLHDIERGACRVFDGVLGPEYNAAHRDHFHLESGGFTVCR
jgi:hypothetical protein